jgi:hypothetical protein
VTALRTGQVSVNKRNAGVRPTRAAPAFVGLERYLLSLIVRLLWHGGTGYSGLFEARIFGPECAEAAQDVT